METAGRVHRGDAAREPLTDPGGPAEVGRACENAPGDKDAAVGVGQLEEQNGLPVGDGVALEGQAAVAAHGVKRARLQKKGRTNDLKSEQRLSRGTLLWGVKNLQISADNETTALLERS